MNNLKKYIKHFNTITKHKIEVFKECKKMGITWQGIVHDLSKYSILEFFTSAKYFQGDRSPIDAEKEANGYSLAWANHKAKNKHHWQYWVDWDSSGRNMPMKIPKKYIKEMICDWVGAGKIYGNGKWNNSEPLEYWNRKQSTFIMHEDTKYIINLCLIIYKSFYGKERYETINKAIKKYK